MPASLNKYFEDYFGVELLDGYGITETATMVTMNWPGPYRVPGSCGLPVPGLAVRLTDPSTGLELPLIGDVYARGRKEGPEVLGSFLIDSVVVRSTGASDGGTRVLELSASGSVSLRQGRRVLTATLNTIDITNESSPDRGCVNTLSITGEGD